MRFDVVFSYYWEFSNPKKNGSNSWGHVIGDEDVILRTCSLGHVKGPDGRWSWKDILGQIIKFLEWSARKIGFWLLSLAMKSHQVRGFKYRGKMNRFLLEFSSTGVKGILELRQMKGSKIIMKLLPCYSCIARKPELRHVNKKEKDGVKKWLSWFYSSDLVDCKGKDNTWKA